MSSRLGGLGLHRGSSLRVALAPLGVAISGCVLLGATTLPGTRWLIRLGRFLLFLGSRYRFIKPSVVEEIVARSINVVQTRRGETVEADHVSQQSLEAREFVGLASAEERQFIRLIGCARDREMGRSDALSLFARRLAGRARLAIRILLRLDLRDRSLTRRLWFLTRLLRDLGSSLSDLRIRLNGLCPDSII